jgi:hypothetical protein
VLPLESFTVNVIPSAVPAVGVVVAAVAVAVYAGVTDVGVTADEGDDSALFP